MNDETVPAPAIRSVVFSLPADVIDRLNVEELREVMNLAAAMLAAKTPARLLTRRLQGIRSYEYESEG